jgi:hypothetical protein
MKADSCDHRPVSPIINLGMAERIFVNLGAAEEEARGMMGQSKGAGWYRCAYCVRHQLRKNLPLAYLCRPQMD